MFEKPPGPRHKAIEKPERVVIRIPSKRNIFIFGFLSLWLCGWLIGEITVLFQFSSILKKDPSAAVFLIAWICGWTLGGAVAIYIWLWQLKGREIITVSPMALTIKRDVLGFGRARNFDVSEIRKLRTEQLVWSPFDFRSGLGFCGIGGGTIAFDYGFQTVRFGAGIAKPEAEMIVKMISNRLAKLAETA